MNLNVDRGKRLTVASLDSPGSSVFDLPALPSNPGLRVTLNDASDVQVSIEDSEVDQSEDTHGQQQALTIDREEPSCILISGGTGGNAICSAFRNACFVLPVSDDGGSSSEIIRVLGGPSVGAVLRCRAPFYLI